MMENPEFWLQFGLAGVFLAYFIKKEAVWEAEKKEMSGKYESLLREALTRATNIDNKLDDVAHALQNCKIQQVNT